MRSILLTIAVAALLGSAGCVTPAAVKEASTKHKTNLASLHGAVGAYRKNLGAYYDRLSRLQRDAYVSHLCLINIQKLVYAASRNSRE